MGARKLIKEGPLTKAKSGRKLYGFLCSDILVLTDASLKMLYKMVWCFICRSFLRGTYPCIPSLFRLLMPEWRKFIQAEVYPKNMMLYSRSSWPSPRRRSHPSSLPSLPTRGRFYYSQSAIRPGLPECVPPWNVHRTQANSRHSMDTWNRIRESKVSTCGRSGYGAES
jgi:hypothetical protein